MKLSVVIPVFNEEKYLPALLASLLAQDFPHDQWEIIFADGRSSDRTLAMLQDSCNQYSFIRVIDNPRKYVSFGLNEAIRSSKGEVILRLDAHSRYPKDYVRKLYERLISGKSWNVGGVWIIEAANDSAQAKAIAIAIAHPFAAGNAAYKMQGTAAAEVDTVPYGCFRRQVFIDLGLFDEDLIRNQDDELNGRIRNAGYSITLYPDIQIRYTARPTISKLVKMYFGYGLFKPLVNVKLGAPTSIRQFAPPLLALIFLLVPICLFISQSLFIASLLGIAFYFALTLLVSLRIGIRHGLSLLPYLFIIFPSVHLAYGLGYLMGLIKFTLFKHYSYEKQTLSE